MILLRATYFLEGNYCGSRYPLLTAGYDEWFYGGSSPTGGPTTPGSSTTKSTTTTSTSSGGGNGSPDCGSSPDGYYTHPQYCDHYYQERFKMNIYTKATIISSNLLEEIFHNDMFVLIKAYFLFA